MDEILIKLNERFGKDFTTVSEAIDFALTQVENNAIGVASAETTDKMNAVKEICINVAYSDATAKAEKSIVESVGKSGAIAADLIEKSLQQAKKYCDDLTVSTVNALTQSIKETVSQFRIDVEKLISEKSKQLIVEALPNVLEDSKKYTDTSISEAVFKAESAGSVATAWTGANLEQFKKRVQKEIEICSKVDRVNFDKSILSYESSNGQLLIVDVTTKKIVEAFSRLQGDDLILKIAELRNAALTQLNVLQPSQLVNVIGANSGTLMM
jgi:hypothetical protein